MRGWLAFLLATVVAAPARAACPTTLATTATVTAAAATAGLPRSAIVVGQPTTLALLPIGAVHFAAAPARPAGPYGGMFSLVVPAAGSVRIALGSRAWVDVAQGRVTIASVAHRPGAACTGIAKEVVFPLLAGRQVIEISGGPARSVAILVTPGS